MTDSKPWWQSRTLLGAFITLASAAASASGLQVDSALQGDVMNTVTAAGSVVGAAISIWGRLKADSKLSAS
ncbi:hypothetical protein [Radicibacter daui]|uniref:hypothetical protein n=1 Tax=Radicibacter daui TaxID=3064829 RepID=UPI0040468E46